MEMLKMMTMATGGLDEWYVGWRRMVMSDTTPWGLCPSCAAGFSRATSQPATPPKAEKKATKKVRIEADSVEEAKQQAASQVPKGLALLSTKVESDGSPKTATGEGTTEEEAYSRAEAGLPAGAAILEKKTLSAPARSTVSVKAFDAKGAAAEADRQKKDARDTVGEAKLVSTGKKGFLGLGKTPDEYEVDVMRPAVVELTYRPKAAVTAEYGEPKKTRAKPKAKLEGQPEAKPEAQAPPATDNEGWTPKNPQYASGRPLDKLERLFVLTSGSGEAALESPVVLGTLEDAAEAPFAKISGRVNIAVITNSDVGKVAAGSGGIPDAAWDAIANIDTLAQRAPSKGEGFATHSIATDDPRTGDHFLLVLVYAT